MDIVDLSPSSLSSTAICLDGRNLALPEGTGVNHYAMTLKTGLERMGRGTAVLLDCRPGGTPRTGRARRWLRAASPLPLAARLLDVPPYGFAAAWVAPDAFRLAQVHVDAYRRLLRVNSRRPPGLMHWTYPLPMMFAGIPNVYTIHDLIPLRTPRLSDINNSRHARIVRAIARTAAHIVTVSETSRRDIIALLDVPAHRVTNTYQPVSLDPGDPAPPPARRGRHFLFCGTIEPRKNLPRLIAAYRASGAQTPLILAGPDGWRAAGELAAGGGEIRDWSPSSGVWPTGHGVWRARWLPRAVLLALLRDARALLFPSLAEGFGLPIVEAMALGVPVLTSRGGATEEIAGAAAALVDPLDTRAIAEAIAALDRQAELREGLSAAGLRRSTVFSPAACFGRLEAVYHGLGVVRA